MAKDIPTEQLRGRAIGRILVKMGILTREKVHQCLAVQKKKGGQVQLGQVMLELGMVDEKQLKKALAAQGGMEYVDLAGLEIDQAIISQIPAQMANAYRVIPLDYDKSNSTMSVAIDSADNYKATDDLSTLMGFKVKAKVASPSDLDEMLKKYYSKEEESINDLIGKLEQDDFLAEFQGRDQSIDLSQLKELAESNPVKKLLNLVLLQAIKDKASDVHFEPFEDEYKMRYRIDGVLYEMIPPPKHIAVAISSRIKVMANLDIAERRMPQDGRIPLTVQGNQVDLRVSILPTMFGESVVLRILDRSQLDLKLENLGMSTEDMNIVRQLIQKPNGILIVTGPTGSGKTTTLYSALKELMISTALFRCR
jgi:type IV pilus assembly protein PilB